MRVTVDGSLCQAYANCVSVAPEVFDLDEATGTAVVLVTDPPTELHGAVQQAEALCPTRAIAVITEPDHG
jgi:ferredoxin